MYLAAWAVHRQAPRLLGTARQMTTEEMMCTITIPCSLVKRAEATIAKHYEDDLEGRRDAYLREAVTVGLGVLERSSVDAQAARVKSEFEALTTRLAAFEVALQTGIQGSAEKSVAKHGEILDKYLGQSGEFDRAAQQLRTDLGDETKTTSIPASTARAVAVSLEKAVQDVTKVVDSENGPMARFLRSTRTEATQLRMDLQKAQDRFAAELKNDLKDITVAAQSVLAPPSEQQPAHVQGRSFEVEVSHAITAQGAVFLDSLRDTSLQKSAGSLSKVGDIVVDLELPDGVGFVKDDDRRPPRIAVEVKSGSFTMSGEKGIEAQLRAAMASRDADVGLGVVTAKNLPKRWGWYTHLKDDIVIVAFEPELDYGDVALHCAYRVLRANAIARYAKQFAVKQDRTEDDPEEDARYSVLVDSVQAYAADIARKSSDVLAAVDRLRRMKKNTTDAIKMLTTLRQDLDDLERDIKSALRDLDADVRPLLHIPQSL